MNFLKDTRVLRSIIGATWSIPLRYVTLSAQLSSIAYVAGIEINIPSEVLFYALSAGVLAGWAIRLVDNLLNEFLVFETFRRKFLEKERSMSRNDSQRSLFKRVVTILGAAHLTLSSKSAVAAVVTTGAAAALASAALGFDPLAWGIGGLGGAYIYLRSEPSPRKEVAANLILSILLGGIASPVAYALAATHYVELHSAPGQYLVALILSFGWPQISRVLVAVIIKRYGHSE